jgi:hypothetical protein
MPSVPTLSTYAFGIMAVPKPVMPVLTSGQSFQRLSVVSVTV